MGAGRGDPFTRDRAFAGMVAAIADGGDGAGAPPRLVVLGDLFDFPAAGGGRPADDEATAVGRLERIAAAHPVALAALASYAAGGGAIDLLAGNHDADLVRPAIQARVRDLLGGPGVSVAVHPWILHVPGILYAEHGHQHHDINAFAAPLKPWRPDAPGRLDLPPGAVAHGARAFALLLRRGAAPRARARRAAYRSSVLPEAAGVLRLSPDALRAIDAATPRGASALAVRTARRVTTDGRHPAAAQRRAALSIHRVLQREGRAVPCYAFGHTHVAECRPLEPGRDRPVYVNPGTWSTLRRRGRREQLAYVAIEPTALGLRARLVPWTSPRR